jgi:3-methyladenine DNA glycosylase AlkD
VDRRTVVRRLRALADPERAAGMQRYFKKDAPSGDQFLGIRVPDLRKLAREFEPLSFDDLEAMLDSPVHEERVLALLILVRRYRREPDPVYSFYFRKIDSIDHWDLVDAAAREIVGAHGNRAVLYELARSASVWKRRIAVVATHAFIRRNQFGDTLRLAQMLLRDPHDLIHKAAGWMLREVGDRDKPALEEFLKKHVTQMPRTMLRYAIEKFPEEERQRWLRA